MPVYVVTIRKQIAQTFLVDAMNATEAKKLARGGDDRHVVPRRYLEDTPWVET